VRAWVWSADREDSVGRVDIDTLVDGQEKGNEVQWRQARYLQAVVCPDCSGLYKAVLGCSRLSLVVLLRTTAQVSTCCGFIAGLFLGAKTP
jgi:hypothetical protein